MSAPVSTAEPSDIQRFVGGKGWVAKMGGLGALGLAAAIGGFFVDRKQAAFSYLVAFTYWAGIALASLILIMIFHAFRAKWMVVIRRPLEAMATTVSLFLPLFIPIFMARDTLYLWAGHSHGALPEHEQHLLHHKAPYLNVTFFLVRTILYLLIASFVAWRLWNLSNKQDETGDVSLTQKARNLGAGALPLMALVITFAAFDWLMSLDPFWFSTIFGVYYFGGSTMSVLAVLIIVTTLSREKDNFGSLVTVDHMHNLGKLLFAFTAFWGYIAFSQTMLIWVANLPEETPFYITRMNKGWAPVGIFLILGHFVLPFFLMLSRGLKRNPVLLRLMAAWALLVHFVDVYWLVFPTFDGTTPAFPWMLIAAWVGIGGLATAFAVSRVRGRYAVPVKDPFLNVSIRYRQPV